jgi:hypothetical protein
MQLAEVWKKEGMEQHLQKCWKTARFEATIAATLWLRKCGAQLPCTVDRWDQTPWELHLFINIRGGKGGWVGVHTIVRPIRPNEACVYAKEWQKQLIRTEVLWTRCRCSLQSVHFTSHQLMTP